MPHFQTGTATNYRDLLDELRDFVSSDHVDTAVVNAAGTGYSVGDLLTVTTGTSFVACTCEVLTLSGSTVLTVGIRQSGGYTVNPTLTNVATTVVPSGGTGCTLDLTMTGDLWTVNRDDQTAPHQAAETELLLEGVGSGSDEIFVGIRSYENVAADARNWELMGATGFDGGNTWENQPGKSPGDYLSTTIGASVVPLANSSMNYWFNVDGRRIIMVAEISGAYSSCYLGFMNPFATDTEYPYPLLIMGSSSRVEQRFSDTFISYSGIADPIREDDDGGPRGGDVGPGFFRAADGVWTSIYNGDISGTTRGVSQNCIVMPTGDNANAVGSENQWYSLTFDGFDDFVPASGTPGTVSKAWRPTPDSGGDIYPTWPCTIVLQDSAIARAFIGEMDDVRWFPALIGPVVAEDTLLNDTFTVFQNGNRSEPWALFLMRTRN